MIVVVLMGLALAGAVVAGLAGGFAVDSQTGIGTGLATLIALSLSLLFGYMAAQSDRGEEE